MPITAYTLAYQHWTVIPRQMAEDFREMRDCGFDAVALSFSESEMAYSRRAFEIQIREAHRAGLRVHVIPSRLGGRFAGAPLAPSLWLSAHPECVVPGPTPSVGPLACLESRAFIDWIRGFLRTLLTDYELDGIVWDEPKGVHRISTHPDTLARFGPAPTVEDMELSFLRFLGDLVAHCGSLRPGVAQTLFCQKTDPERFTRAAAAIPGLRWHGYDGNLARQSVFHEPATWRKYRIESVWERTAAECAAAGVGTFALVENMLMPGDPEVVAEYEANLDAYLAAHRADHLALYYFAHNNGDPHAVHEATKRQMRRHLG